MALGSAFLLSGQALAQSFVEDSEISITKGEAVRISSVDDWLVGVFTALDTISGSALSAYDRQCVFSTTGAYQLEVVSGNGGTRLNLQSGSGDGMNYRIWVVWRNLTGTFTGRITNNTVINVNNLRALTTLDCADDSFFAGNLWFRAQVLPGDFNAAPPGIYQDFVTINVRPE